MIVFWNCNEVSDNDVSIESITEHLVRFIDLIGLWDKHIVVASTDGGVWGQGLNGGVGSCWDQRAKRLYGTLMASGINVVDFSRHYGDWKRAHPEMTHGYFHFANVPRTTEMWHDLTGRIAKTFDEGFVAASWKVAARTRGGMGEQRSK